MGKKIKPILPSGFNDYLPPKASWRFELLKTIKNQFENFGFLPLETPAIEQEKTLTGGDKNFKKEIFRIKKSNQETKEELALRFDLTVPLARVMTLYPNDLPLPFKRYSIGNVWRGEKAQGGRFREFLQCDVDIVGSESVISDAEIIALMYQVTLALGFQNFLIKINSREILNALPFYLDFPSQNLDEVLRIVDKLDKIGERQVKSELEKLSYLNREKIKKLITLFNLKAKDNVELINLVQAKLSNEYSQVGFKKLKLLIGYLDAFGVPSDKWVFDLATVRGLSYYTGFVFEVILLDLVEVGSIFSGGRYDGLSEKLGGNFLPAVGASLGFDRAFYALEKLGIIETTKIAQEPKVMVIYPEEKNALEAIKIVQLLRNNEISANIYLGKEKTLRGQLAYCLKNNYQVAIIVGEEEIQKKKVAVKIFKSYQQINVKIEDLPLVLKKELKS